MTNSKTQKKATSKKSLSPQKIVQAHRRRKKISAGSIMKAMWDVYDMIPDHSWHEHE